MWLLRREPASLRHGHTLPWLLTLVHPQSWLNYPSLEISTSLGRHCLCSVLKPGQGDLCLGCEVSEMTRGRDAMLQYSGRSDPVTRVGTCSTPVSALPLAPAGGVGTIGVSDSSAVGQRPGSREVRREPRGCGAEQPRSVQPDGDVPSPPPLWARVTRTTSGRATGEGNAQVPEIRIRDPPQPPACLSAQGPRRGRLPRATEFGAGV